MSSDLPPASHRGDHSSLSPAIEVVRRLDRLAALEPEWTELFRRVHCENPFLSFAWVWSAVVHLESRRGTAPRVLALRQGERLQAVVPLALRYIPPRGGMAKLELLPPLADLRGVLSEPEMASEAAATLVRHLHAERRHWDVAELRTIPADGAFPLALTRALQETGLRHRVRADAGCMVLPIQGTWEEFLQRRSRNFRHKFHRLENLWRRDGLRCRVADLTAEPEMLPRLVELEARKEVKHAPQLRQLEGMEPFFQELFSLSPGSVTAALAYHGGRLVAYEFALSGGRSLHAFAKAYDPAYGRYSPGNILLREIYEHCCRHEFQTYNMGRGELDYKSRFGAQPQASQRWEVWNSRLRSRLAAGAYFRVRPALLRARIRAGLGYAPPWDL